jgi:hypothetical protein
MVNARARIRIPGRRGNPGDIELDGKPLRGVTDIEFDAGVQRRPKLVVRLAMSPIDAEVDADIVVAMSPGVRESLIRLGWTPPAQNLPELQPGFEWLHLVIPIRVDGTEPVERVVDVAATGIRSRIEHEIRARAAADDQQSQSPVAAVPCRTARPEADARREQAETGASPDGPVAAATANASPRDEA